MVSPSNNLLTGHPDRIAAVVIISVILLVLLIYAIAVLSVGRLGA